MNRCRGTLLLRSRMRRSAMPCSCSRSTSRSRVRAEVMPMPLKRGPSMKLVKIEPPLETYERVMASQVDLQRSYGREPFRNGVKVRARPCVLSRTRIANPVYVAAARILRFDDGLGAVPAAEARHLDAAQLPVRQIRHIDVEDHGPLLRAAQRILRHSAHQLRRQFRGPGDTVGDGCGGGLRGGRDGV